MAQKAPKPQYDLANEIKVRGMIEDIKEFQCPVSGTVGYHIVLRSGEQPHMVHVAASRFMKEYEISFAKGDEIQVLGSKVKLEGHEEAILAREITRGQNTYAFRDKQGRPLW